MDANHFNERLKDATDTAIQQARDAITSLEVDLKAARRALDNAQNNEQYSWSHFNAYGNRYLAVPKALSRAAALIEVQAAARELDGADRHRTAPTP